MSAPARAVPLQKTLGQRTLPNAEKNKRFQTGFIRVGHFFKNDLDGVGARPDGTGTAYNMYQLYFNDSFEGKKSNFIADTMFLSDKERGNNFNFTQFNYLLGMAFKGPIWTLQFEREEDLPLDRGGVSYRYWDARASMSDTFGEPKRTGPGRLPAHMGPKAGPIRGSYTLMAGYFLHNNSYPARPTGRGVAQMRYRASGEVSNSAGNIWLVGSADFLTQEHRAIKPVGMDVSYGVAFKQAGAEVSVLREYRKVLDGPGFFPYWLLQMTYAFDTRKFK